MSWPIMLLQSILVMIVLFWAVMTFSPEMLHIVIALFVIAAFTLIIGRGRIGV
jgi:hypothetical protein